MRFTLVVPYYRNPEMLAAQVEYWRKQPPEIDVIVVDDGSPEPAVPIVEPAIRDGLPIRVLKIMEDIPWNQNGARNLGTLKANTDWVLHVDIDHVLPPASAEALLEMDFTSSHWYRFARYRVGRADETRKKDGIPEDKVYGKIHPHINSFLCERDLYIRLGGYDEDYCGSLGGATPFLKELEKAAQVVDLKDPYCLNVFTRDAIPDANDTHLSRDTSRFRELRRQKKHNPKKPRMCQYSWVEVDFSE